MGTPGEVGWGRSTNGECGEFKCFFCLDFGLVFAKIKKDSLVNITSLMYTITGGTAKT